MADGRRADAIDDNPSVDRWVCAVAPIAYPITVVAYRYGTRGLRLGLRKANASVAWCRFDQVLAAGTAWSQQPAQPSNLTCSFVKGRCDSGCASVQKLGQSQSTCQMNFDKCMQTGT